MEFVAIDFETANRDRGSACAVGWAVARGGAIVRSAAILLKPEPFIFDPFNVKVHGIIPSMVRGAPTLAEAWPLLRPVLEGAVVLAHNAAFDMSVLRGALDRAGIEWPTLDHACTCQLARRAWPGLRSYTLGATCAFLGIELDHHEPGSDARACAGIALRAFDEHGIETLADLQPRLGVRPRKMHPVGVVFRPAMPSGAREALPPAPPALPRPSLAGPRRRRALGHELDPFAVHDGFFPSFPPCPPPGTGRQDDDE